MSAVAEPAKETNGGGKRKCKESTITKAKRAKVVTNSSSWEERLCALEKDVQERLNAPYLDTVNRDKALRFEPGHPVVSCHNGLYYTATVKLYVRMMKPDSLYPDKTQKIPAELLVPTMMLHFDGWSSKHDTEVAENEVFDAVFRTRPVDTFALLVAHEWNLLRRNQLARGAKGLGRSAFLMNDRMYAVMEAAWKEDCGGGQTLSFGQFCGRLPGPYRRGSH
ncbi:hypothetical protein BV898_10277 [Hypsibius exemplaris]|uniref:Uncharacterized protein n=1 Tax=Hypsibius exemplaris TaxID=2072580 RepID=A0A1W0WK56_HYPEX|nr:hypothetical protein BV898_10277 [Hypsibius exemplaris]